MVVDEHFVVSILSGLPLDVAAPFLGAGITVYGPLRYFGLDKPNMHLGVVGLGGLGHLAVKFAKALDLKVSVIISTSPNKKKKAIQHLGADSFVAAVCTLDGIIDTISAMHPLTPLIDLLKSHGKLVMVGAPEKPLELLLPSLIMGRKTIAASYIGGVKETQEIIDFATEHNVRPQIEVIPMDYVNIAMERLLNADVKYRFVIDIGNILKPCY
ncbi:hypothetical protein JHK87_018873 [Glycine soja]|nr:hypothetical protein JHK87_018873 [Glycine soja]